MDRRKDVGLDQPLSSAGPRLRAARPQGRGLRAPGHDPPQAPPPRRKTPIKNPTVPERLLAGQLCRCQIDAEHTRHLRPRGHREHSETLTSYADHLYQVSLIRTYMPNREGRWTSWSKVGR